MKYIKDGKEYSNLINADDVIITDASDNTQENLSEVLKKQTESIKLLKSGLKYLTLHGGMGGSGSGSGSSSSTKISANVSISYTDSSGLSQQISVTKNVSKNITIKVGTSVKVTVVDTTAGSGSMESKKLQFYSDSGSKNETVELGGLVSSRSFTVTPTTNDIYHILINGSSLQFTFKVFTRNVSLDTKIVMGGNTYVSGSSITSRDGILYFDLTNYQPETFTDTKINTITISSSVSNKTFICVDKESYTTGEVTINDVIYDGVFYIETVENKETGYVDYLISDGSESTTYQGVSLSRLIDDEMYGIYKIKINYTFNNTDNDYTLSYIYKDDNVFVYLYSDDTPFYPVEQKDVTEYYGQRYVNYVLRLYKANGDAYDKTYNINLKFYKVTYDENQNQKLEELKNYNKSFQSVTSDTNYENIVSNIISSESDTAEIKVVVSVEGVDAEKSYFFYLGYYESTSYFYQTDTSTYYNAVCFSTDAQDSKYNLETILGMTNDNQEYKGDETTTWKLKDYLFGDTFDIFNSTDKNKSYKGLNLNKFINTNTEYNNIIDIIEGVEKDGSGNDGYDYMISFSVKYNSEDYSLCIFQVNNGSTQYNFYKDYVSKVEKSSESSISECTNKFSIPADEKYHMVNIYVKDCYDIGSSSHCKIGTSNRAMIYIDGVMNTQVFSFTNFTSSMTITLCEGDFTFNHLGIAFFNPKPTGFKSTIAGLQETDETASKYYFACKYFNDFDPVIPSNYYQVWNWSTENNTSSENAGKEGIKTVSIVPKFDVPGMYNSGTLFNYYGQNNKNYINKFIRVNPTVISSLLTNSNMEMYCICPDRDIKTSDSKILHNFIKTSMLKIPQDYDEEQFLQNNTDAQLTCEGQLKKWVDGQWENVISDFDYTEDSNTTKVIVRFKFKFQGSSTLLFGAKNFSAETLDFSFSTGNDNIVTRKVYWNPDSELFRYPEKIFNLKADIVDSSHSNNTVIGAFVNNHMTSPYSTESHKVNSALVGKPIILFINNNFNPNYNSSTSSGDESDHELLLGIYNLNLSRDSEINMGYSNLPSYSTSEDSKTGVQYVVVNETNVKPLFNDYAVAEIQDNSNLYDFSQYDPGILKNQMYGDFKNAPNGTISYVWNSLYPKPHNWLRSYMGNIMSYQVTDYIYPVIDKDYIVKNYTTQLLSDDTFTNLLNDMYMYDYNSGNLIKVKSKYNTDELLQNTYVIDEDTVNQLRPYRSMVQEGEYYYPYIFSPKLQFTLLLNVNGSEFKTSGGVRQYIIKEESLLDLSDTNGGYMSSEGNTSTTHEIFDINSSVMYYIICMAFAMVDSVQKNITVKRVPTSSGVGVWYPAFYDMDTAFALTNSSGDVDFRAFSAYIYNSMIINDYADPDVTGWFDVPSSYLFMFAKYAKLLDSSISDNRNISSVYNEWVNLRKDGTDTTAAGDLSSSEYFCKKYVDSYFGCVNPLIWNLNYHFKYFSYSENNSDTSSTAQTEMSMFNGDRKYYRKDWLNDRLHFIDVLFGVMNLQKIGRRNDVYIGNNTTTISSADIEIQNTMFPSFVKGATLASGANIRFKADPNTAFVFKTSGQQTSIWITPSTGILDKTITVSTNTEVGFYGSKRITEFEKGLGYLLCKANTTNMIQNNLIKYITIDCGNSTIQGVSLNICETTPAVKDIKISTSFTYGDVSIGGQSNNKIMSYDTVDLSNFSCDNLIFENCTIKNLYLNGVSVSSQLQFNNCTITNFYRKGNDIYSSDTFGSVGPGKLYMENSSIKNYADINGKPGTLNEIVLYGKYTSIILKNVGNSISLGSNQYLTELTITGCGTGNDSSLTIPSFGKVSVCDITNLKFGTVTLGSSSEVYSGTIIDDTFTFNFNSDVVNPMISFINFPNVVTLTVDGYTYKNEIDSGGYVGVVFGEYGLSGDKSLKEIKLSPNTTYSETTAIIDDLSMVGSVSGGNYVFQNCESFTEETLSMIIDNLYYEKANFLGMFAMSTKQTVGSLYNSTNLKRIFEKFGKYFAGKTLSSTFQGWYLGDKGITDDDYTNTDNTSMNNKIKFIEDCLSKIDNGSENYVASLEGTFYNTGINFFTIEMAKKQTTSNNRYPYSVSSYNNYTYIEGASASSDGIIGDSSFTRFTDISFSYTSYNTHRMFIKNLSPNEDGTDKYIPLPQVEDALTYENEKGILVNDITPMRLFGREYDTWTPTGDYTYFSFDTNTDNRVMFDMSAGLSSQISNIIVTTGGNFHYRSNGKGKPTRKEGSGNYEVDENGKIKFEETDKHGFYDIFRDMTVKYENNVLTGTKLSQSLTDRTRFDDNTDTEDIDIYRLMVDDSDENGELKLRVLQVLNETSYNNCKKTFTCKHFVDFLKLFIKYNATTGVIPRLFMNTTITDRPIYVDVTDNKTDTSKYYISISEDSMKTDTEYESVDELKENISEYLLYKLLGKFTNYTGKDVYVTNLRETFSNFKYSVSDSETPIYMDVCNIFDMKDKTISNLYSAFSGMRITHINKMFNVAKKGVSTMSRMFYNCTYKPFTKDDIGVNIKKFRTSEYNGTYTLVNDMTQVQNGSDFFTYNQSCYLSPTSVIKNIFDDGDDYTTLIKSYTDDEGGKLLDDSNWSSDPIEGISYDSDTKTFIVDNTELLKYIRPGVETTTETGIKNGNDTYTVKIASDNYIYSNICKVLGESETFENDVVVKGYRSSASNYGWKYVKPHRTILYPSYQMIPDDFFDVCGSGCVIDEIFSHSTKTTSNNQRLWGQLPTNISSYGSSMFCNCDVIPTFRNYKFDDNVTKTYETNTDAKLITSGQLVLEGGGDSLYKDSIKNYKGSVITITSTGENVISTNTKTSFDKVDELSTYKMGSDDTISVYIKTGYSKLNGESFYANVHWITDDTDTGGHWEYSDTIVKMRLDSSDNYYEDLFTDVMYDYVDDNWKWTYNDYTVERRGYFFPDEYLLSTKDGRFNNNIVLPISEEKVYLFNTYTESVKSFSTLPTIEYDQNFNVWKTFSRSKLKEMGTSTDNSSTEGTTSFVIKFWASKSDNIGEQKIKHSTTEYMSSSWNLFNVDYYSQSILIYLLEVSRNFILNFNNSQGFIPYQSGEDLTTINGGSNGLGTVNNGYGFSYTNPENYWYTK
jgi:hypothetical protein